MIRQTKTRALCFELDRKDFQLQPIVYKATAHCSVDKCELSFAWHFFILAFYEGVLP